MIRSSCFVILLMLISHQCFTQVTPLINSGHSFNLHDLAISDNGRFVASASGDKSVIIWDVNTGKMLKRFTGIGGQNLSIAYTSSNDLIINNAQYINTINSDLIMGKEYQKYGTELSMGTYVTLPVPESTNLIINDGYSLVKEFDQEGKEVIVYEGEPSYLQDAILSSDQNILFGINRYGGFFVWDRTTGNLISSFKGIMDETLDLALSEDGTEIAICGASSEILIYNVKSNEFSQFKLEDAYGVGAITYLAEEIIAASGNKLYRIDRKDHRIKEMFEFTLPISKIKFSDDGKHLLYGTAEFGVGIIECQRGFIVRDFMTPGTAVKSIFSHQNYVGFQGTDEKIRLIDLTNIVEPKFIGRAVSKYYMQSQLLGSLKTADMANEDLIVFAQENEITVTDKSTGSVKFQKTFEDDVLYCGFTMDDQHVFTLSSGYSESSIEIIDLSTGETVFNHIDSTNTIKALDGNQNSSRICYAVESYENYTTQVDLVIADWKENKTIVKKDIGELAVTGLQLSTDDHVILSSGGFKQEVKLYSNTLEIEKEYKGRVATISQSSELLAIYENKIGEEFADITIINLKNGSEQIIEQAHLSIISHLEFGGNEQFLVSASWDKTLKIWDLTTLDLLATYIFHNGEDENFIVFNSEGYFFSTRDAAKDIHFVKENNIYLFEQFDATLNRPDKILELFPGSNPIKIDLYKQLYKKRINRQGIDEGSNNEQNAPSLQVTTSSSDYVSQEPTIDFLLEYSSTTPLTEAVFTVNGVPTKRESIEHDSKSLKTSIHLQSGENRIAVYVEDENGNQSLKHYFKKYRETDIPSTTYVVTIGVSSFEQSEFDLTYAAKDAEDIGSYFKQREGVNHILITNDDFTKEQWTKKLEPLNNASIDDRILIFISTHGILDQQLDYYLATHDIDFNNPSEKGVSVAEIEKVFGEFSPIKKVIFLDACHSGELDKEEIIQETKDLTFEEDVSFRSVGSSKVSFAQLDNQSSLEACKTIFTDLSSSSGISIVSSASAVEFAREGNLWANGVFTFCLLEGLRTKSADTNGDGEIHIVELTNYLHNAVYQMTNGKQQPSSRVQNVLNDFSILED